MTLGRCACGTLVDSTDDPGAVLTKTPEAFVCAFCRGEESYEEATLRQTRLYRAIGKRTLDRATIPVNRRTYAS